MLFDVGDSCPRSWGCIRTGGGGGGGSGAGGRCDGGGNDDDDGDDDADDASLDAYDLAANRGTACCPGSQCVPTRKHRRRRKSSAHGGGRDKSPGKEPRSSYFSSPSPIPLTSVFSSYSYSSPALFPPQSCGCWPRCLSSLSFVGRFRSGCCTH